MNGRKLGEDIALILPSFRSGGAERVVVNVARGLTRDGVPVRVLVLELAARLASSALSRVHDEFTWDLRARRILTRFVPEYPSAPVGAH